jgi:hypothetical protein
MTRSAVDSFSRAKLTDIGTRVDQDFIEQVDMSGRNFAASWTKSSVIRQEASAPRSRS